MLVTVVCAVAASGAVVVAGQYVRLWEGEVICAIGPAMEVSHLVTRALERGHTGPCPLLTNLRNPIEGCQTMVHAKPWYKY